VLGYIEQGTTTTPYSMLRMNDVSRFHIADLAVQRVARQQPNSKITVSAHELGSGWKHQLRLHERYTLEHGEDPSWCTQVPKLNDNVL
jgi:xylulose-5-phosphate/fructose-6-phosphate phosphoketolase